MAGSRTLSWLLLAALVACAAAAPAGRGLRQVTASASSVAVANGPGSNAQSSVSAVGESTGKPTTVVAQGASIADAGETVITECNAYARDSAQYKQCINTSPSEKSNVTVNTQAAAQAGVLSYDAAPTCPPPVANYTPDTTGRLWSTLPNGTSCAFRFANGQPVYAANVTGAGVASTSSAITFESAPTCPGTPTTSNSTKDGSGRLWGSLPAGGSCAYKDGSGKPLSIGSGGGSTANANANATAVSNNGGTANANAAAAARSQGKRRRLLRSRTFRRA